MQDRSRLPFDREQAILGHLPESAYVLRCLRPSGLSRFDKGTCGADLILEFGQPEPITNDPRWPSPSFVDLAYEQSDRRNPLPFCDPQVPDPLIGAQGDLIAFLLLGQGGDPRSDSQGFTSSVLPDSGCRAPRSPPSEIDPDNGLPFSLGDLPRQGSLPILDSQQNLALIRRRDIEPVGEESGLSVGSPSGRRPALEEVAS